MTLEEKPIQGKVPKCVSKKGSGKGEQLGLLVMN
jgi:hypothetical protein